MPRVVAILLLFGRLWTRFCFLAGRGYDFAYLPQLKANIEKMLGDDNSGPVAELNRKIGELDQQILQRTRAKQDCDDLGQEVIRLREEKYQLQLEDATKESTRQ